MVVVVKCPWETGRGTEVGPGTTLPHPPPPSLPAPLWLTQGLETKYMEILRFQASEEESWAAPPPVSQSPPCNR